MPSDAPLPSKGGETDLWRGRSAPRAFVSEYVMLGGWWLAMGAFGIVVWPGFRPATGWWWGLVGGVFGLPALVVAGRVFADAITRSYRLTSERLFVSRGVLMRETKELDLMRVKDLTVSQSIWERIGGAGSVTVYSTDTSDPVFTLERIADPHGVKEKIRAAVQQRRSGTMYVEKI